MQRLSLTLERRSRIGLRTTNIVLLVVPCFRNFLRFSTQANINTNYRNTVGKETVIIADRQAAVTLKKKKQITQELRLEIFKTSAIIFSCYFRILERGSIRHREKSQSQSCWSISDFVRALLVKF